MKKSDGFELLLANRSKKPRKYTPSYALYVRDCKLREDKPAKHLFEKTLAPGLEISAGKVTFGGSAVELFHIDFERWHCEYQKRGHYWVSVIMRPGGSGALRSNELEWVAE